MPFKFPDASNKHNPVVDMQTLGEIYYAIPKRVVDVGAGSGFYGRLINLISYDIFIIAVETYEPYAKQYGYGGVYNKIIFGDILKEIDNPDVHGDLIIFGDVLEHLQKEQVFLVLDKAIKKFSYIIINTPDGFMEQKHEISSEIHRCGLVAEDFKKYNILALARFNSNPNMLNVFIKGDLP